MSEHFVDYASRVDEVYEIVRHSNPPQEPKTFDDVLRCTFLNVADDLAAARQRIEELETFGKEIVVLWQANACAGGSRYHQLHSKIFDLSRLLKMGG